MTHRVGLQDMDIGEAFDTGPFRLPQEVQVGPEIHFRSSAHRPAG
jgi:hypothetical protein